MIVYRVSVHKSEQISRNWLKLQESLIREICATPSQLQSARKIFFLLLTFSSYIGINVVFLNE